MARFSVTALQELAARALAAQGAHEASAQHTAQALVQADRAGVGTHGVSRIPDYVAHIHHARVDGTARPQVVRRQAASVLIDARGGLAYEACAQAVDAVIDMARQQGIGLAAVANSHHFGAAGGHLDAVAAAGLVGLALGNSPAAMPAWQGRTPLFGTNPVAAVFPRREGAPVLIDLSLSAVSRGKLVQAARDGRSVPDGWGVDAQGQPSTDPQAILDGMLLPAGGVKGAMLALAVELLAAALTGSHFGYEADSFLTAEGGPPRVGQVFIAIDPGGLAGQAVYLDRVEAMVGLMLADPDVRLPGARRVAHQQQADADGIEVPDALVAQLQALAAGARSAA